MMANIGGKVMNNFRDKFKVVRKDTLQWFPGHMSKGIKQMQSALKRIDCIIEVHDARIPISGRHANFKKTITGVKPHILVLNKLDLADLSYKNHIISQLNNEGIEHVIFTNFNSQVCKGMKTLLPLAKNLIMNSNRYNRTAEDSFSIMIVGVPNVGKSSLINRLRNEHLQKGNATKVGAIAGITRSVLTRIKISEEPTIYVLDTPGILSPEVKDVDTGLKLALVGCLQDHLVGTMTLADYLLFTLNKQRRFEYVNVLNLLEPTDSIKKLLTSLCLKKRLFQRVKTVHNQMSTIPNYEFASQNFIKLFRAGEFGKFCLDKDLLKVRQDNHDTSNKEIELI
ncbi:mitochondrial GTPase 1 [Prorops nasuta]|uniref:mitochondrial GTPase 1 n=1 Tax=Prorops nasuta TaxID=863751 RepID=UPI0034CFB2F9